MVPFIKNIIIYVAFFVSLFSTFAIADNHNCKDMQIVDFGNSELVMFEAQGRYVSINLCINEAASKGTFISSAHVLQEPKNETFSGKYDGYFSTMTYLYQNRIYMIEFHSTPSDDVTYLSCRVLEVKEGG